ncbi:MAG: peptidylprolyl isomerase [Reyranella sp.]|nr:peptidylprolyl isomerase [Reyranella sp.]
MATTPRRRVAPRVPVSVNGVVIPGGDIARETQHHHATDPDEAWNLAARALVIRELLSQEVERLSIVAEPLEDGEGRRETPQEARLRALIEREVDVPSADEAACRRYYDANTRRFRSPDLFEAAHILFVAAPDDGAARDRAREAATALVADLVRDPAGFVAAAAAHSACPSSKQGGNLGQVSTGQTVPEFETALRGMVPGVVHPRAVESRYGLHVVRLDRRIDGEVLPFDLVRDRIADYLDEAVRRRAQQQYVSILAGRAQVTGVELAAARGPLVQ